jgi:hypothetical protein
VGTQPSNLKCDILVSKFGFKWANMCRYAEWKEMGWQGHDPATDFRAGGRAAAPGGCMAVANVRLLSCALLRLSLTLGCQIGFVRSTIISTACV